MREGLCVSDLVAVMLRVWLVDGDCVSLAVFVGVSDMEGLAVGDAVPVVLALEDCVSVWESDCVALGVLVPEEEADTDCVSDGLPEVDGVEEVLGVRVRLAVTDAVDVGDGDSVALILNVGVCEGGGVYEMRSGSSRREVGRLRAWEHVPGVVRDVAPALQQAQGPEHAAVVKPVTFPYVPAGQSKGALEPLGQ